MNDTSSFARPPFVASTRTGVRCPRKNRAMQTTRFTSIGSRVSLYILMSSPNVKYDTKMEQISHALAMKASTKKAGWRIASLAVAMAMVRVFMDGRLGRRGGWKTKFGQASIVANLD